MAGPPFLVVVLLLSLCKGAAQQKTANAFFAPGKQQAIMQTLPNDGGKSAVTENCDNKACCDIKQMTGDDKKDSFCQTKFFGAAAKQKATAAAAVLAKQKEFGSHVQGDLFLTHKTPKAYFHYKMKDSTSKGVLQILGMLATVSSDQIKIVKAQLPANSAGYVTKVTFSVTVRRSSAQGVMQSLTAVEHSQAFRDKLFKDLKKTLPTEDFIAASISHVSFLDANPDTPSPTTYHFPTPKPTTARPTAAPTTPTDAPTPTPTLSPTSFPSKEPTRAVPLETHVAQSALRGFGVPTKKPTMPPTTLDKLVIQVALLGEDIHNWWDGSLVRKKFLSGLAQAVNVVPSRIRILGVHADPKVKLGVVVDAEVRVRKHRELHLIQQVETIGFSEKLSQGFGHNAFRVKANQISVGITFGDLSRVVVSEDKSSLTMGSHATYNRKTVRKLRLMLLAAGVGLMAIVGACAGVMWATVRQIQKKREEGANGEGKQEAIPLKSQGPGHNNKAKARKTASVAKKSPPPKSLAMPTHERLPMARFRQIVKPAPKMAPPPKKKETFAQARYEADDDDLDLGDFEFDDDMADDLGQEVI